MLSGTFDVQDITAVDTPDGKVDVTCCFVKGSQAKGCFLVFVPTASPEHPQTYAMAQRDPMNSLVAKTTVSGLQDGCYKLLVYDMESSSGGLPGMLTSIAALVNISASIRIPPLALSEFLGIDSYSVSNVKLL